MLRRSAKRHTHADFASALAYGVGQHAIGSDDGQQEGYTGEDACQHGRRAAGHKAILNEIIHGFQLIDRQLGIDLQYGFP